MTLRDRVRGAIASNDPKRIGELMTALRFGISFKGQPRVTFNYKEQQELFQRCDPSCDADRFEELCQMVDEAEARS